MPAINVDRLLLQDLLIFTPRTGSFDSARIRDHVEKLPYVFEDKARPERFLVCADEESRDTFRAEREANPSGPFPFVLNIELGDDAVLVWPASYIPELEEATRGFIGWITDTFDCAISNDFDTDMLAPEDAEDA